MVGQKIDFKTGRLRMLGQASRIYIPPGTEGAAGAVALISKLVI